MSDHETTLRETAAESLRAAEDAKRVADTQRDGVGRAYWRGHEERMARKHAACLAGADALRRGTCGTCNHWGGHKFQRVDTGVCRKHGHRTERDDGCIKGYAPTEPTR